MDRRSFLALSTLGASYSLAIDARRFFQAPAEPQSQAVAESTAFPDSDATSTERHMRTIDHKADVFIAGGGMAGVCAALAAARNGAKVFLVQDRSRLGGNASSEIRMHIVGADAHGSRPGWREGGLIEEIRLEDAVRNPHRAWELFDLTLYDLVKREPDIELRLDTSVYHVEKQGSKITRAWARCDKTETIYRVGAELFCDCTGDSRLGLEAGAAFRTGREPREEFGEKLAQKTGDPLSQGSSILFTAREHEREMPYTPPPWARKITENDLLFRKIPRGSYEYGYWWIELGGTRNVISDNEELRYELLRVVLGVWDWIKNSGQRPDSANWALETVGMIPGKRESRRLEGDHIQTQSDLTSGWKQRDDGVSIGGWAFDDHPPKGFDDWKQPPVWSRRIAEPYNIAFEAMYSRNVDNLLMAGRNISNSHVAFTSTRVMATCACIGQAVGTAAALCAESKVGPRELRKNHITKLQQRLLRDDQSIRGVGNEDPGDLARRATVTSDTEGSGRPENVIDGHVRDKPGQWKHRFGAKLGDGRKATLRLGWDRPVEISHVQITFDSGFHRQLTLSASDRVTRTMIRGPQPETVRDYELRATVDGNDVLLARVEGNYQRLRRHSFQRIRVSDVRLVVSATNGAKEARVFEVRCYA